MCNFKTYCNFINILCELLLGIYSQKFYRFQEMNLSKSAIEDEIQFLKDKLEQSSNPIVFAHNDLLLGNVIYTESTNSVTFIDYEYAGYNYQAFDIGNHFAEFVGK